MNIKFKNKRDSESLGPFVCFREPIVPMMLKQRSYQGCIDSWIHNAPSFRCHNGEVIHRLMFSIYPLIEYSSDVTVYFVTQP